MLFLATGLPRRGHASRAKRRPSHRGGAGSHRATAHLRVLSNAFHAPLEFGTAAAPGIAGPTGLPNARGLDAAGVDALVPTGRRWSMCD